MDRLLRWDVGDVSITALPEIDVLVDVESFFPGATRAELGGIDWFEPDYLDDGARLRLQIQTFLIGTPQLRIVVDTGYGNNKQRPRSGHQLKTDLLERMAASGFVPTDVDMVVCTHLHVDHVGWNTELHEWVPTFPNARYLFTSEEYTYRASSSEEQDAVLMGDSVQPVVDAGLVDLVGMEHRLCDEVRLISTGGHTPGHVSVLVSSRGQQALISGDIAHHPAQLANVDWSCFVDCDPEKAIVTRGQVLAYLAASGTLLIGTHFPPPTAGFVQALGGGFALVPPRDH